MYIYIYLYMYIYIPSVVACFGISSLSARVWCGFLMSEVPL